MNGRFWRQATYAIATALLLSGCGLFTSSAVPNTSGLPPSKAQVDGRTGSWMLPKAKKSTLLYISDLSDVDVYSYPAKEFVGQLSGITSPEGLCSDSSGNVFVTDTFLEKVAEYAHGSTQPIKTFTLPQSQDFSPIGCSVDPGTNNLAVQQDGTHNVYIFKHGMSKATAYYNPYGYGYVGGTYDGSGNFFMRGTPNHISELPKGSSTFININVSRGINPPGGFAWDGKYLSITNGHTGPNTDYRIHLHGTHATIVSKTLLSGSKWIRQFTIFNHRFIAPDQLAGQVTFWKYPAFGNPVGAIEGLDDPIGSAISVAR